MLVYRLEDSQGGGPYSPMLSRNERPDIVERMQAKHHGCDLHPGGRRDIDPNFLYGDDGHALPNIVFGCPSRELLEQWFEDFMPELRDMGFTIRTYKVRAAHVRVGYSGLQLAFDRIHATLVTGEV